MHSLPKRAIHKPFIDLQGNDMEREEIGNKVGTKVVEVLRDPSSLNKLGKDNRKKF